MPADKGTDNERINRSAGLASDGEAARRRREKLRAEQAEHERAMAEEEARREAAARRAAEEKAPRKRKRANSEKRAANTNAEKAVKKAQKTNRKPQPERLEPKRVRRAGNANAEKAPRLLRGAALRQKSALSRVGEVISEYWKPFVLSSLAILAAAGIALSLSIFLGKRNESSIPDEVTLSEFGKTSNYVTVKSENGRMLYVYADSVFAHFGASVTGDSKSVTVVTKEGESAAFTDGSDCVSVNGKTVHMKYPAIIRDYRLLLPMSFISDYVTGIDAFLAPEEGILTIEQTEDNADGIIGFTLKAEDAVPKIEADPSVIRIIADDVDLSYDFVNDLSAYLKFMNPVNRDDYLILVSPSKPDDGSFVPDNLISVQNARPGYASLRMEATAEKALEAMFLEMYAAGYKSMYVNAAYRSYTDQKKTFDNYVYNERYYSRYNYESTGKRFSDTAYSVLGSSYLQSTYISKGTYVLSTKDAERVVSTYSAVPGRSDHQTGLGVDIHDMKSASKDFATHDAYTWLKENAYKFGFVERFPEGKEKITGFAFEPYHWRFVGQYHAAKMHAEGVCLEEYIAALAN